VSDRSEVRVELDIFSGRPNPSWMLAPPERDELLRALGAAQQETAARELPGLGYRGFAVHVGGEGRSQDFHVGAGRIETAGRHFVDRDQAVEKHLIRTMPPDIRAQFSSVLP
jgi:hypothetical protein